LSETTRLKVEQGKRLNRKERAEVKRAELAKYNELKKEGVDEVSNSVEAIQMRNYRLRNKKRKGILRKRKASLAEVLFPGVAPDQYKEGEPIPMYVDLVESRKNPIPYEYYDLPFCEQPRESFGKKLRRQRKNLGMRLQGHDLQVAPFAIHTKTNLGCKVVCNTVVDTKHLRWMRKLIVAQYRVQFTLDRLPLLMRNARYNFASRGCPIGFQAPSDSKELAIKPGEIYIFNHLKFVITYHEDPSEYDGVRITAFDVQPVSIKHGPDTCKEGTAVSSNFLPLRSTDRAVEVTFSYEVEWVYSDLEWADRWDVYLIGSPDDDLHYFSIVNSLMIVIFLTGAIGTIMIRTLRKDIAVYNEMDALEDGSEETGWKLVHGDVFRPPQTMPMALSVVVGTGAQICVAFGLAMLAAIMKLLNPVQKGQTLTALLILYVLCGSVAGYVSARIYKFTGQVKWKVNIIATAVALPGLFVVIFLCLNVWLSIAGAATAVSFFTIVKLFLLWTCVSAPLVFVGGAFGLKAPTIEVPTKTNQIARMVPDTPWHVKPLYTIPMGGILPFGSVCIELAFIMSALWLHQIYYVMGFLLAVLLILIATCAQVSIVLTYLQLCAEDHRWWWPSLFHCASAGGYLFLYSLWFLASRLEMVGFLPVVIYLTYMGMISICFGLVCGSIGFLSAFSFNRIIYGAVKVD
jgi:transmembrane 9 superfamily protein 2/4